MTGRWQLNLVKSHLAPAPAWRSQALLMSRDGDWTVRTVEYVYAKNIERFPVRYREDGKDYPAASKRTTYALTRVDDRRWKGTEKLDGAVVGVYDQTLSPDGHQLTIYHTTFDRRGKPLGTSVEVFDKIR
ncbi:MAG TPA: hypothetical protein VH277_12240 [Gemmatimonadaceae bacterium]|nr:hypothetical protein [Gemmatimonadaceae bacterium]